MKNWKSTLAGLAFAIAAFLGQNANGTVQKVAQASQAAAIAILGVVSKDAKSGSDAQPLK